MSHRAWVNSFGGSNDVIGTRIPVDGKSLEVIGVTAPGLRLPNQVAGVEMDFWMPMVIDREGAFGNNHVFQGLARLAPGATVQTAQSEMLALTHRAPGTIPKGVFSGIS